MDRFYRDRVSPSIPREREIGTSENCENPSCPVSAPECVQASGPSSLDNNDEFPNRNFLKRGRRMRTGDARPGPREWDAASTQSFSDSMVRRRPPARDGYRTFGRRWLHLMLVATCWANTSGASLDAMSSAEFGLSDDIHLSRISLRGSLNSKIIDHHDLVSTGPPRYLQQDNPRDETNAPTADNVFEKSTESTNQIKQLVPENTDRMATNSPENDDDQAAAEITIIGNSRRFIKLFSSLMGVMLLIRTACLGAIWMLKGEGTLRLAQPSVLALLVFSGSIASASCIFLIVHPSKTTDSTMKTASDDLFCRLRDPMILMPLSLAGCILLGRVWRILLLLTPILEVRKGSKKVGRRPSITHLSSSTASTSKDLSGSRRRDDEENEELEDRDLLYQIGERLKVQIVLTLTHLSDSYHFLNSKLICCGFFADCWSGGRNSPNIGNTRRLRTAQALRKTVPTSQLLWLVFLMMIPQTILQVLNQSVPALRETLEFDSNFEVMDGYFVERPVCRSSVGLLSTYVGFALALIPYIFTGILTWNSSDDLPKVFDEARAMTKCFKMFGMVFAVAFPPLVFLDAAYAPDTFVYLLSTVVFGLTVPPTWFIVYPKIYSALGERLGRANENPRDKRNRRASNMRRLLQRNNGKRFLPTTAGENQDHDKAAKLALKIGKMYEEMGNHQKSLDLFNEALSVWECDPSRSAKEKTGGFTQDEINAFSVSDLECIIQLLIAKGRVEGTFNSGNTNSQNNAAHAWLDALEIYEQAPARAEFKDRSILFPIFSGIFIFLKGERIKQDEKCSFEQNLVRKFVREAKLHGDPVHYTRALAMYCEAKAQVGNYQASLNTFESLKELYDPLDHSEAVAEAYGTDRSAQAFSQSALWHMQLGNTTAALDACEYVLTDLMPLMDPKNILNSCEMLLPIMRIYKARGDCKRMRDLFDKYVIQNFLKYLGPEGKTPCKPLFKPLIALLEVCHDPGSVVDMPGLIEWLVEGDNGVLPDFVDNIYTKRCWSMHNLTAELCLRVANYIIDTDGEVSDAVVLTKKSLSLCQRAEKKMKNGIGEVIMPVAYELHEPVYLEVRELADMLNVEVISDASTSDLDLSKNHSIVAPKHLASSLRGANEVSDGSASSESPHLSRIHSLRPTDSSNTNPIDSVASSNAISESSLHDLAEINEPSDQADG